ncbi:GspH/FimT family pseudopilin [Aeromonas sp. 164P]
MPTGFTLIELMVTIALTALLLTVGIPSFNSLLGSMNMVSQSNEFVQALQLARTEAVRRNQTVRLSALPTNVNSTRWEAGWQVWVDANANDQPEEQELIRVFSANDKLKMTSQQAGMLMFAGNGAFAGRDTQSREFNLQTVPCNGAMARKITVSAMGQPSVQEVPCS